MNSQTSTLKKKKIKPGKGRQICPHCQTSMKKSNGFKLNYVHPKSDKFENCPLNGQIVLICPICHKYGILSKLTVKIYGKTTQLRICVNCEDQWKCTVCQQQITEFTEDQGWDLVKFDHSKFLPNYKQLNFSSKTCHICIQKCQICSQRSGQKFGPKIQRNGDSVNYCGYCTVCDVCGDVFKSSRFDLTIYLTISQEKSECSHCYRKCECRVGYIRLTLFIDSPNSQQFHGKSCRLVMQERNNSVQIWISLYFMLGLGCNVVVRNSLLWSFKQFLSVEE
jgi:hypothetical protein